MAATPRIRHPRPSSTRFANYRSRTRSLVRSKRTWRLISPPRREEKPWSSRAFSYHQPLSHGRGRRHPAGRGDCVGVHGRPARGSWRTTALVFHWRVRQWPAAFLQLGHHAARRQHVADEGHHLRDRFIGKTMTGQLLARAVVEGRATLDDDVAKYLAAPYTNLENDGQRILLKHLANMSTQLADNIPDITQVRPVSSEPLAVTRMRVFSDYSQRGVPAPADARGAAAPAGRAARPVERQQHAARCRAGKHLRRAVRRHPHARDRKAAAHGQRHAPERQAAREGLYGRQRASAAVWRAIAIRGRLAALQHRRLVAIRVLAARRARRVGEARASADWPTPDGRLSVAFYWIGGHSPLGRRLYFSGTCSDSRVYRDLYPEAGLAVVLLSNKEAEGAQASLRALSGRIAALARPSESTTSPPSSTDVPLPDR